MNKNLIIVLLVIILPIIAYFFMDKTEAISTNNVEANKPQIIKFTSDMCSECQKLDKIFPNVYSKYSKQIVLIKVPVQKRTKDVQNLITKYNVNLIPTMVFLNSSGKVVLRTEGSMTPKELDKHMKDLINE